MACKMGKDKPMPKGKGKGKGATGSKFAGKVRRGKNSNK